MQRLFCILSLCFILIYILNLISNTKGAEVVEYVSNSKHVWTYECVNDHCKKELYTSKNDSTCSLQSLNVCRLFCGRNDGVLWPKPTVHTFINGPAVSIGDIKFKKDSNFNQAECAETKSLLHDLEKLFKSRIKARNSNPDPRGKTLVVSLQYQNCDTSLTLESDEHYNLQTGLEDENKMNVMINGDNFYGIRHGVETLSQLIVYDDVSESMVIPKRIEVQDRPKFPFRAITLDTSRNYISIASIKRVLDGMGINKLNVFHWHITDTHSFPFESKHFPQFTKYGAYSPDKVYKESDIKELLKYAKLRGIRIIPEFDAPAHVGEGWQWAPEGSLLCLNKQPWDQFCVEPPCGQLNPTSNHVYEILQDLYQDILEAFEVNDIFHMGGDEVHFRCWEEEKQIQDWMKQRGWNTTDEGFLQLWNYFQSRALDLVQSNVKKPLKTILWTSHLTTGKALDEYLDKSQYIIQIWTTGLDKNIGELLSKGYKVIFSNYDALYLDCGFAGWVTDGNNWCTPYKGWQQLYDNNPIELSKNVLELNNLTVSGELKEQVLGQSAALWTEQADDQSIDGRIWPRGAAMAERTWSDPATNWKKAETRFLVQRERLVELGIAAEAIEPQWCLLNEGQCPM